MSTLFNLVHIIWQGGVGLHLHLYSDFWNQRILNCVAWKSTFFTFSSVVGSDYAGWCRVSGSAGLRLIWRLLAPVLSQGTQDQAGPTLTLRSVSKMALDKHLDLVFNVLRGNLCPLGALSSCFPKGPWYQSWSGQKLFSRSQSLSPGGFECPSLSGLKGNLFLSWSLVELISDTHLKSSEIQICQECWIPYSGFNMSN